MNLKDSNRRASFNDLQVQRAVREQKQKELAEKYVNLYCEKTGTDKKEVQRWIPIVAAIRKTKEKAAEQEMLEQWINIVDYE